MTPDDASNLERLQDALAGIWSIEREIGRGGMGVVYQARDVALDRPVAIKLLHPSLARNSTQRERFLVEARTGARLSHPHIVPVYAVEERTDFVYFVMALIDGESAGEKLRREGPMEAPEVERILRDIGWGLAYAHAMNLVHRDVTLDNILIERSTGRAVLADFGIASEIDQLDRGPLIGTPAYLAPEIIQGEPPTPQSDLYALGIAGWSMLAGRHPFIADDTPSLLLMHVTEVAPLVSKAAPRTPSRLTRAIQNALEKDPTVRAGSTEEWLESLGGATGMAALADPLRQWLGRWERAKPFYALGMSVFAMLTAKTAADLLNAVTYFGPYFLGNWSAFFTMMINSGIKVLGGVLLIHAGLEVMALRRLAARGYGVKDIRLVLARNREELRRSPPTPPSLLPRVVHDLGWLAGGLYVLLAVSILKYLWLVMPTGYEYRPLFYFIHSIGQWAYVAFWSALGFSFLMPVFRFTDDSLFIRARAWLWNSAFGVAALRLAAFRVVRADDASHTLHRPTELVLDLAIEDLWRVLPVETRRGLGDIPALVEALRRRISAVRVTERLVDESSIERTDAIRDMRLRLAERHHAGVSALERIRLLLAQLGSAAAPLGEFTAQLEDARAVERSLVEELGAHPGLLKQLKAGLRQASPTPTPAG